jgi:hypothetical protein
MVSATGGYFTVSQRFTLLRKRGYQMSREWEVCILVNFTLCRMVGDGMSRNYEKHEEVVYPPNNFSWIVKDELAAMARPGLPSNLRFLEKQGIKHLVTLSPEMRPPIHTFPELKWTEIPVEEFCSPSVSQMKEFIDICQKSKTKNEVSIYVI